MAASSPRRSTPENEMRKRDQLDDTEWEWVDSDETGATTSGPQRRMLKPRWWQETAAPKRRGPSRAIEQTLPYHITSWHSSPETMAPGLPSWRASLTFAMRSPEHLLPEATLPWRENIAAHCYEDRSSLDYLYNPEMIAAKMTPGTRRMVRIAWVSGAGTRAGSADNSGAISVSGSDSDWQVTIDIFCANGTWLDGLSRDEVAELVRFDTAYKITARLFGSDSETLEVPKDFLHTSRVDQDNTQSDSHPKYPKAAVGTTSMSLMALQCKGLWRANEYRLDIEDLEIRRVVYENIGRHINGI